MTRILPHSDEDERAVLGAILLTSESIFSVLHLVNADDFYDEAHREIFTAMCALVEESIPIDAVTVRSRLKKSDKLGQAGEVAYLMGLTDGLPRGVNVEHYARSVRDKSILRGFISKCHTNMIKAFEPDANADLIEQTERDLFALSERQFTTDAENAGSIVDRVYRDAEERSHNRGRLIGLDTGLSGLNRMTGGLQKADLIILAARPGMGKTSLALNIAGHAASKGNPALVFSLEMSRDQLMQREICSEACVDSKRVRCGALTREDWMKFGNVSARISEYPLFIDDTAAISMLELRAKARRIALQKGIKLIVVDYLQLMTAGGQLKKTDSRVQEIGYISRGLKALAKELKIPVVALAQLNRSIEQGDRKPRLSDLRESGSIEQDADIVMFLHPTEAVSGTDPDSEISVDLILEKHRNGPQGVVPLRWFRKWTRFRDLDTVHEEVA